MFNKKIAKKLLRTVILKIGQTEWKAKDEQKEKGRPENGVRWRL